jgi:hypothetical protein
MQRARKEDGFSSAKFKMRAREVEDYFFLVVLRTYVRKVVPGRGCSTPARHEICNGKWRIIVACGGLGGVDCDEDFSFFF